MEQRLENILHDIILDRLAEEVNEAFKELKVSLASQTPSQDKPGERETV